MDGRPHPPASELPPSYYGHSIGRWDNDTLVIDTVGFNERAWMNRDGIPHTDRMHLIERVSRPDFNTLKYEVTIEDPGAFTAPWNSGFNLNWSDGTEMFEYLCQDNNYAPETMVGNEGVLDVGPRRSTIVRDVHHPEVVVRIAAGRVRVPALVLQLGRGRAGQVVNRRGQRRGSAIDVVAAQIAGVAAPRMALAGNEGQHTRRRRCVVFRLSGGADRVNECPDAGRRGVPSGTDRP